ncbi:MAG: hypothetical protein QM704_13515 [Anaeromyxobacteraceae bacterium]
MLALAALSLLVAAAAPHAPPARFLEGVVSTGDDDAHVAFTPDGQTMYFLRSTPDFAHWTVMESRRSGAGWTPPEVAPWSGEWDDGDVFVTRDGAHLYFISNRPTDGGDLPRPDTELWVMDRRADGRWGPPRHLEELSSPADEWFPTLSDDGTIYFGSERPGGAGKSDLWRARWLGDRFGPPENLGPAVNGPDAEIEPLVSGDGRTLVFAARGRAGGAGQYDLFVSFACAGGFTPPRPLGAGVNSEGWDFGPRLSPDGRTFYFTSNRNDFRRRRGVRRDAAGLAAALRGPGNGLRDVYRVDAAALGLTPPCPPP